MPDVYDAGAIRAHADLNRDPFIEGLQVCRQQGRAFAAEKFTATADVDTKEARRQLAQLQIAMRRISEETVDVDVDTDGIAAAIAELEALRAEQQRVERTVTTSSRNMDREMSNFGRRAGLIRVLIEQLGPPLIPLAGGLIAASTAFVGLGVAGIAALKGIQAEYKAGTPLGVKYAGMLRVVKTEADSLGKTAAHGVLEGLNRAIDVGNRQMPEFNRNLADSSRTLGDITEHLVGGLIGGFNAWYPLIQRAEGGVDRLVARFEDWATGPGGAQFMQTLLQDLEHAGPAIGNILSAVSQIVSAFHPVGIGMLDAISGISEAIDDIPVEVLQAAATAYIAFRTAVLASKGLDAISGMLYRLSGAELAAARSATVLAAAQSRAALAGGGWGATTLTRSAGAAAAANTGALASSAGWLAAATKRLIPFAVGWTVATVGINAASAATEKWKDSTDTLNQTLYTTTRVAKDILSFNWGDIDDAYRHAAERGRQYASTRDEQRVIDSYMGYQPAMNAGVVTPQSRADPRTVEVTPATRIPVLGISSGGYSTESYVKSVAEARTELAGYRQQLSATLPVLAALNRQQSDLAASGQKGSQAWRDNAAQFAHYSDVAAEARHNIDATRGAIEAYQRQVEKDRHQQSATASRYAGGQASRYSQAGQLALSSATSLTAGTTQLDAYQKSLQRAIAGEEKWTKVTGDDTIKIGENIYTREAWDRAIIAGNGNRNKAIGLLEGHTRALAFEKQQQQLATEQQARLNNAIGEAELRYKLTDAQVNVYAAALGVTSDQLATGEVSTHRFLRAVGQVAGVIDHGSTAVNAWVAAVTAFQASTDTTADRAALLGAALVSFNGDAISFAATMAHAAGANQQFVDAFREADKSVVNLKTGFIDWHNAGAAPVLDALQGLQTQAMSAASAIYQHDVAMGHSKRASKDAADVYRNDTRGALIDEARQLGITRDQAQRLADRYFHWPKNAKTQIEALGGKDTNDLLDALGRQLSILTGKPWLINVHANVDASQVTALRQQILNMPNIGVSVNANGIIHLPGGGGYAKGGKVREGYFTVGEEGGPTGWELGYKRGSEVHFLSNRESRRRTGWRMPPATVPQFAGGSDGAGGFTGVTGTGGGGSGTFGGGDGTGDSGPTDAEKKAAETRKAIEKLLRELSHDRIGTRTLKQLDKAASSTVLEYANSLLDQARRAVKLHIGDRAMVKDIRGENADLRKELKERDRLARLREDIDNRITGIRSQMKQERSTVAQGILGGFDIGTSGNGYTAGIEGTLEQQLADAQKFAALRKQAKALGLDKRLLRQITREGPETAGANLEAIVAGGRRSVRGINADYDKLADLANRLGGTQAREIYGGRLAAAQEREAHIAEQQRDATRAVNGTLREIRRDLNRLTDAVHDDRRRNGGQR